MKPKNLVILAVLVLAFGAYLLLFERHRPTTEESQQEADAVLQGFERDDVVAIAIDGDSGRVSLEKEGDGWRLVEPIEFPADAASVSSTLSSLGNLRADRRLPVADVALAEYGLDDPKASISLRFEDGGERTLEVGDELPLGSKRALRIAGGDEVVIAPGWFLSDLERPLDDWRSRDVVELALDEVASIDIEAGEDSIRAVRLGDRWQLLSPLEDLADRDHLQGLVSDLGALRIEEFLDVDVDPAALGLDEPEYRLTVIRSDGGEPLRLELGATREGEGGAEVALRRGGDEYFWVADRVRTRLSKAPVLWRSKKLWPLDTWEVEGLRLIAGDSAVALVKEDFSWRLADATEGEVEQGPVNDRLNALAGLEATDYDLVPPPTGEMGRVEVTLSAEDEDGVPQAVSYTFFAPLEEGGRAVVRVSGRDTLMGVDVFEVERILGDLDELVRAGEAAEAPATGG